MKLEGNHTFSASREQLWELLMDPEVIAKTIPGCQKMDPIGEDEYESELTIGIAAVKGKYASRIKIEDKVPPEHFTIRMQGKGARGFMSGTVTMRLEDQGDGKTVLHYTAENQIGGAIAAVGQRVIGAAAKMFVNQGFRELEKQLESATNS